MAQEAEEAITARPRGRKRRMLRNAFRVVVALLLVAVLLAWFEREQIADDFIADTFRERGVRASYTIDSIGPGKQVLSSIVIGDPARPDLTVERLEVLITPRLGIPDVTELRLIRPRIYGTYRDGILSFGDLDPFVFTGGDEPFEFPALELVVDDGRGLLQTDYGDIGIKLAGSGHLRGGFSGELAAVAPTVTAGGCAGEDITLYGEVAIDAERPELHGPLRFAALDCENGLALRDVGVAVDLQAERNLTEYDGDIDFAARSVALAEVRASLRGEGSFAWHDEALNLRYDVTAEDAATPWADIGMLGVAGRVRALDDFARLEVEGDLVGDEIRMGPQINDAIATSAEAGRGTMLEPLLNRLGLNLARELRGSTLSASFTARQLGERSSIVVPDATLRGGSGASLFALSRGQLTMGVGGIPRFTGNFATGGDGLPQVNGRMEQASNGVLQMRLAMREYGSGTSRLALPELMVVQGSEGQLALDGRVLVSGPLPGGAVSGLVLPVDATMAEDGSFAMWRGCRQVRFDRLAIANLVLGRQGLTLCPQEGQPILRYGSGSLQFAAGTSALDLSGELAETPIRIASGPVGAAYPGTLAARDLDITLGPAGSAQRFAITDLRADLSADTIGGEFAGADIFLATVPLDILDASGTWSYIDDRFAIAEGAFTLVDREAVDRFEPMTARGATLALADNVVTANAQLRHPASDTVLSRVEILHDLGSGTGHADLFVDGVTFGPDLQPNPPAAYCLPDGNTEGVVQNGLTCLALGVVSDVEGTVSGTGRIDWDSEEVTSSGRFSSDSLDLAAGFGPVRGASGTVVFTDLLGLTTAPDQHIAVAAVNPGIEVYDGEVVFQLVGGELLSVERGTWPFMGGTLTMRPVDLRFGVEEVRRYELVIEGLQASQFVERMELGNVAATGTFDGTIPIVFDAQGNGQLQGGILVSRPPGGHLSYVGQLTYEDLSYIGNLAFGAIRDLRFDRAEILMDGPLTGELVTRVRFDGVGQGVTAERNIITRTIANLPIQLLINIRAPFYQLISTTRSLYDPSAVRDPRSLGLLTDDGTRLREAIDQETVDEQEAEAAAEAERRLREALNDDETPIQPQESENTP